MSTSRRQRVKGEDGAESREAGGDTGGGGSIGRKRKLRSTWRDEEERIQTSSGASIDRDSHIIYGARYPRQYSCLKNPRTEKLGRLQSMVSQRVGHD